MQMHTQNKIKVIINERDEFDVYIDEQQNNINVRFNHPIHDIIITMDSKKCSELIESLEKSLRNKKILLQEALNNIK